jgi:L-2-hydroxyglutarate oxidase
MENWNVTVVGAGIVGLATARELLLRGHGPILVLEKEPRVAAHQSGHNSGVIHSGLYYKPGSLKAMTCRRGKGMMEAFCQNFGVPWEMCGKIVVATSDEELPRLATLAERGQANGVQMTPIDASQIRELEPHAAGIRGLHVPETGIVNFSRVCEKLMEWIGTQGGRIDLKRGFLSAREDGKQLAVETTQGRVLTNSLINCGGLYCDHVFRDCGGGSPPMRIVPFRGEYYDLKPACHALVRNLIYPVPDPAFPFLGVHFTRMAEGGVECGPNAVLALAREGYGWTKVRPSELLSTVTYTGFLTMARRYFRMGVGEMWRSVHKGAFVRALQKLLPEIRSEHLVPGRAGVRAQAVAPDGGLVDDFLIRRSPRAVHVLNAPSPAATASLAIAEHVVDAFEGR